MPATLYSHMADNSSQGNKVEQVMAKWDLTDIGSELEQRWLGDDRKEHSVRDLATYFNRQVFAEALADTGTVPLEGEIKNLYRLLTSEDVNTANKIQAEKRLSQLNIDPKRLKDDFVSHQTMYRYLKNIRGVKKETDTISTQDMVATLRRTSTRLTSRIKTVIRQNLETLNKRDEFHIGEFDIYIDIRISCTECGTTRNLTQILERDGCDCQ